MFRRLIILSLSFTLFTACSHCPPDALAAKPVVPIVAVDNAVAPAPVPAPVATTTTKLPNDVHWYRNSAEQRASYIQDYAVATSIVTAKARDLQPGTWAVILDADETVLDNSQFQKELALANQQYSFPAWNAWCKREDAKALPGAVAFLKKVNELGGKIAIVTNRSEEVREATINNFKKEGIPFDQILCRTPQTGDKNARFEAVENGTTPDGWPPMKVVLWVGDNIQDFPGMQQQKMLHADEDAFQKFSADYIVLPNPMYGSWPRNPMN